MIRIIVKHYGVEFIIVNTINNTIDIQNNKRLKCPNGVKQLKDL